MTRFRVALPVALVALVFVGVIAGGHALAGADRSTNPVLGPADVVVTLTIRHSHYSPDRFSVRPGTTVHFIVNNDDPIGHELIIGDSEVHRRHETGTEPVHAPRPGEISVPGSSTAETTFRFDGTAGNSVVYACHLPGHFRYGMSGVVDIVPA